MLKLLILINWYCNNSIKNPAKPLQEVEDNGALRFHK